MSAEHDDLRILPGAVRQLEDKVQLIEDYVANELILTERKRSAAAFSDEQTRQIQEHIATSLAVFLGSDAFNKAQDIRLELNAGRQAIRFILWVVCSFLAGSASVLVYYLKTH